MAFRRLRQPYRVTPKVHLSTASPSSRLVQPFGQHDRTRQHSSSIGERPRQHSERVDRLVCHLGLTNLCHSLTSHQRLFPRQIRSLSRGPGAKLEGCEVIETRMVTDQSKIEPLSRPSALGTSSGLAAFPSLVTKKIIYSLGFVSFDTQETFLKPPPRDYLSSCGCSELRKELEIFS